MTSAIVTGCSGAVGSALSRMLAERGFLVTGIDKVPRDPSVSDSLHNFHEVDLANFAELTAALSDPPVDCGLVVHAAATQELLRVASGNIDKWTHTLKVNLLSLELITTALQESLKANKPHLVLVTGSIHDIKTATAMAPYAVSKCAVAGWVRSAALDLGPDVHTLNLALGAVDTPMLQASLGREGHFDDARRKLENALVSRAILTPAEVAAACSAILDMPLRHMSGSTLRLDGGASFTLQ